jgi:hypothetical protein
MSVNKKALQKLRLEYKAAFTAYMSSVQALSDADLRRERPSEEVLADEARALQRLLGAREALLKALDQ